jgi:Phosphatidylinositol-4-phosphate 5-Kinase
VYYIGIIDILQRYNSRKRMETSLKRLLYEESAISCVEPQLYERRFVDFFRHLCGAPLPLDSDWTFLECT